MPKIPTFQAEGSIEQLAGTTSNIKISPHSNLASALAPVTDFVVKQKIKENDLQNQAEALRLENDFITDMQSVTEKINTDENYATNKDAANIYLKEQSNALIEKHKARATNGSVKDKFSFYALAETQKTIFRTSTQISKNILVDLNNGYNKQKEILVSTAMLNGGIDRETLPIDLENLAISTYKNQISAPELKKLIDSIPAEIQTYEAVAMVQQTPRKAYNLLKDSKNFKDITYDKRLKLIEAAKTIIRPQLTLEWENYIASIEAGEEPPIFNMDLAKEVFSTDVAQKMIVQKTIVEDTVDNVKYLHSLPIKDLGVALETLIKESKETHTTIIAKGQEEFYRKIVNNQIDALNTDPVDFLIKTDNDIKSQIKEIEEMQSSSVAPEIFSSDAISQTKKEFANLLIEKQKTLGVVDSKQKVMTNQMAESFVNSYIEASLKSDEKTTTAMMSQLTLDYGDLDSKALMQLSANGLPLGAELALTLGSVPLAKKLFSLDTEEKKKSLNNFAKDKEIKLKDIRLNIRNNGDFKDFENIIRQNVPFDTSESSEKMDKLVELLSYYAVNEMYSNSDISQSKAEKNAAELITNNFQVEDTYYIPRVYDGKKINDGTVDGLVDKANLIKDYYLDEFDAVAFRSSKERDSEKLTKKMKSQMSLNGEWRNTPDGEGLIFGIVLDGEQFAPVVNANGEELTFKFNDSTYMLPGTNIKMDVDLKYNIDQENVYAMGGAIKVDLEPVALKKTKNILTNEINNFVKNWNKYYQTDNSIIGSIKAKERLSRDWSVPKDAEIAIENAASNFAGDGGFSKEYIKETLGYIGQVESQYETVVQKTKKKLIEDKNFVASSYWQIEVDTAKDLLKNSSAVFGNNFETSFSKYKNKNKSARASLLMLSDGALVNLLRTDPALAANFAAALVVTRFK